MKRRTGGKFLVIYIRDDDELRDVGAAEMGTRGGREAVEEDAAE